MSGWQPIETAPKDIVIRVPFASGDEFHEYGPRVLAWPVFDAVSRVRWWHCTFSGVSNFIDDGSRPAHPTHWMPLPEPPQ